MSKNQSKQENMKMRIQYNYVNIYLLHQYHWSANFIAFKLSPHYK